MTVFTLPDLGEGLQEAEIVTWHVAEGDHVVADQPLVSVETEKAVVEIPSPQSGRVAKLMGAPGDVIKTGDALVEFETEERADNGTVVGRIPTAATSTPKSEAETTVAGAGAKAKAAPAVRALARKKGVDLTAVAPTGPNSTITAADVERAAGALAQAGPLEPLKGVRRTMARKMARAHEEVAPTTVTDEADIDGWADGTDVTLRLIRAIGAGCAAEPALNAWYDSATEGRRLHAAVHLGLAMDTPEGLFVPVLHEADSRDAAALAAEFTSLKAAVEDRSIAPQQMLGATITLSNFGSIGGRHAVLMVVPPQVAILGAGRAYSGVVAADGAAAVRQLLPLSLTFDHRACTGGEAARFLAAVKADLERPD
ncbi:MAG: dihydrolipoamide acetyltransferase family protein [Alphaproteobacteria bacterium]|nr:dihydrolipoamide acetyltransferase family protein [Alphaproteobacteria bacterium]